MQYYCDIDHLLARVKKATLSVLTEGTGGDVGEEVAELVLRDASAEVDMYLTITTTTITEALAGLAADIAVYLLYFRAVTFGLYNEETTAVVTNNTTDAQDLTTTVALEDVEEQDKITFTVTKQLATPNVQSVSETTNSASAPQVTVENSVITTYGVNEITTTTYPPGGDGVETKTLSKSGTTNVSGDTVKTGTVSTSTTAAKTITEIPQTVQMRYARALEMLRNASYHARLLGYRSPVFGTSSYSIVAVLDGYN